MFALAPDGEETVLHSFCSQCADGELPGSALIMDVDGNLYGTAPTGGGNESGTVFKLTRRHNAWEFSVLYTFCSEAGCADGYGPAGGLTYQGAESGQPYDGISPLYGTTAGDGYTTFGSVYELTPKKHGKTGFKTLYAFCQTEGCPDGYGPADTLAFDAAGNIYGVARNGGAGHGGTVFELVRNKRRYKDVTLYTFCSLAQCADGSQPAGQPALDSGGRLVGAALAGGAHSSGAVYALTLNGANSKLKVLHSFCAQENCADGGVPNGGVVIDAEDNVYGTTRIGEGGSGGTVYKLKSGKLTVLHDFCCGEPDAPFAGLIMDEVGHLYGTTWRGGAYGEGAVFEVEP